MRIWIGSHILSLHASICERPQSSIALEFGWTSIRIRIWLLTLVWYRTFDFDADPDSLAKMIPVNTDPPHSVGRTKIFAEASLKDRSKFFPDKLKVISAHLSHPFLGLIYEKI
jgi:hypothetical protein